MSLEPDAVLLTILFDACAGLLNEQAKLRGRKALEHLPRAFLADDLLMISAIGMLMKFGDVAQAEELFSHVPHPSLVLVGVMLNGYKVNNQPKKCLKLVQQLVQRNMVPDEPIALLLVNACSKIRLRPTCRRMMQLIPEHLQKEPRMISSMIDMWV